MDIILEQLLQGCAQVVPLDALKEKLTKKKSLVIKLGADPTAPDLHLGHAVVLSKMRQFQDAGHQIIFLIGDFTARIGDPTGKSKTRPALTEEEIMQNAQTYFKQVHKILDPAKMKIVYNSHWLSQLGVAEWLKICGKVTVARIIERDDFANRLAQNISISLHELMYPVMQGYDSVELKADLELGGTDQTFNLLMGRHLQEQYGQDAQVIMTMPLLLGLDGVNKMSKSLNNYIGLVDQPHDAFGKIMSISDQLVWHYFELLLLKSNQEIESLKAHVADTSLHPMNLKKDLAHQIVARFWSEAEADEAQKHFEAIFQNNDFSKAIEVEVAAKEAPIWIVDLLKELGALTSSSEAKRLIESGAVIVDEKVITDFKAEVRVESGMIIRVGKKKVYKLR
jgi:tyrosyl-tRNA synthetase